ncbi:MAG: tautomerase family protein [Caulobacteraceae bacterium]
MPLVRIDLMEGKSKEHRRQIGQVVYEALEAMGVPKDDRFQVISEHTRDNFIFAPSYLGIEHTDDLVMIQISLNAGRTVAQKQTLYKTIADRLHDTLGLRRQDVVINLIEVAKENWSFGDGIAPYAT